MWSFPSVIKQMHFSLYLFFNFIFLQQRKCLFLSSVLNPINKSLDVNTILVPWNNVPQDFFKEQILQM